MNRVAIIAISLCFLGATLLLAELRWFRRPTLTERLKRFAPVHAGEVSRPVLLSAASFRDVIGPLVAGFSETLLGLLGVNEDLSVKLQRLHAPIDATAFRLRQAGWSGAGLAAGVIVALAASPPALFSLLCVSGWPLLAFLAVEQQLSTASGRRQRRLFNELPIAMEQLGMLLGAGFSLGAALNRLAQRGNGVIAQDLHRVNNRIRQGLSEAEALHEWAQIADVVELHRLVNVLALNYSGADLGRLVSEEARTTRQQAHRRTIEIIERRAQLVWIPVTVATLVPGVIFMAIPFIEAMRNFAAL